MRAKTLKAVEMKHTLQKKAEQKLIKLSEKEQLELLHKKFGYLRNKRIADIA